MLLKESGGFEARDPWIIYHNGMYYHCFGNSFFYFYSEGCGFYQFDKKKTKISKIKN